MGDIKPTGTHGQHMDDRAALNGFLANDKPTAAEVAAALKALIRVVLHWLNR